MADHTDFEREYAAMADRLVQDWDAAGRMPLMAWDFRGFAAEAMRRAAQPAMVAEAWRPIESAPKDTVGVAILARMTCCGGGAGLVVMTAARSHGVWIYPSEHKFEFIRWCPLPPISEAFEVAGRG